MTTALVRVVDYLGNPGGGVRFLAEMMQALEAHEGMRFEIVSHGRVLEHYRRLLPCRPAERFREIPPANLRRTRVVMQGIPGAGPLNWLLGSPEYFFEVPSAVFEGCDLVWLPWLSRHRIPWQYCAKVVGTLHDVIFLEFDTGAPDRLLREERETLERWLESSSRVVVDANTTVAALGRLFGTRADRVRVVPLSAQHRRPSDGGAGREWPFTGGPYLLCSSNLSPHKNLDVLLAAFGRWGAKIPLVLTGWGTDLWRRRGSRSHHLRRIAEDAGLKRNRTLFAMDYVDDASYYRLLDGAWAVVIPTLAEGAGLPVLEALRAGVPVISSDIPIAREMVGHSGGKVLWFDPKDPRDLAAKLAELESGYSRYKAIAVSQAQSLRWRSWGEVASDYLGIMFPGGVVTLQEEAAGGSETRGSRQAGDGGVTG